MANSLHRTRNEVEHGVVLVPFSGGARLSRFQS